MAGEIGTAMTTQGLSMGLSGAASGAAVGAAIGTTAFPVVGTVIGGAIGLGVGLISGGITGSKARKANKYAKKAAAIQLERERNMTEAQMLMDIRRGRITRASSQAGADAVGISTSSLSTSALSSIGSQLGYNLEFTANDRRLYELYASYMKKAGKAAQSYQNILAGTQSIWGALTTAVSTGANIYAGIQQNNQMTEWRNSVAQSLSGIQSGISLGPTVTAPQQTVPYNMG